MNDQQRAAMQMALDGFRAVVLPLAWASEREPMFNSAYGVANEAITALREALAQSTNSCQNSTKLVETQPQDKGESNDVSAMADVEQSRMGSGTKDVEVAQPQGEPVADVTQHGIYRTVAGLNLPVGTKLYTTPPSVEAAVKAMRDAAVAFAAQYAQAAEDAYEQSGSRFDDGEANAARGIEQAIAALPIPGEDK